MLHLDPGTPWPAPGKPFFRARPEITLFYLDMVQGGVVYTFYGRGRVSADPQENDRVWEHTPEIERAQDPSARASR